MPSPTAAPNCLVEPARTSPAEKTPGNEVRWPCVSKAPAIQVHGAFQETRVGVQSNEHECRGWMPAVLFSGRPVARYHLLQLGLAFPDPTTCVLV